MGHTKYQPIDKHQQIQNQKRKVTIMKRKINIENHFLNERKRELECLKEHFKELTTRCRKKHVFNNLGMNQFCVYSHQ